MKKIIKLTENDLVKIIKKVITESKDYTTLYSHALTNKNNEKFIVNKNTIWKNKTINNEQVWSGPKGLFFTCSGLTPSGLEEDDTYSPRNISKMSGSKSLVSVMKEKLCK